MKKWTVQSTEQVIKDKWIDVRADSCRTGQGVLVEPFYTYHPKNWVLVAAETKSGEWLIVRQYRHGIQEFDYEFPAGNCESQDKPLETAQRELLEETGYGLGDWSFVRRWPFNTANHSNFVFGFLARNVEKIAEVQWDENEEIEVLLWTKEKIKKAVEEGKVQNPFHQLLTYIIF